VAAVMEKLGAAQDLAEETVLISAGPTREPIDPVRYISNRSSGKMGYALAEAALRRGARVFLITGPTALKPPGGADVVGVETSGQMRDAILKHAPEATIVIMTAAVSDYRPASQARQKIKRTGPMSLELEPTADILAELGRTRGSGRSQLLVGFAAETENILQNARKKFGAKSLDMLVVNDVSRRDIGFDSERNEVTILTADESIEVPESTKWEVAQRVLDHIVRLRQHRSHPSPAKAGKNS
jgi:phosphopantothenoylcysteine decarboxylase/phosphopantothenate--cysteine ligase